MSKVMRSGFYVHDGKIVQRVVVIAWDKGFDRIAKRQYIRSLREELGEDIGPIGDFTTASPIVECRQCSPVFVKMRGSEQTVEEYLCHLRDTTTPDIFDVPGAADFIYLNNLSQANIDTALKYNCYSDVFHNPNKEYGNTQALSLVMMRLMLETGKWDLLKDPTAFITWYHSVEKTVENCVR